MRKALRSRVGRVMRDVQRQAGQVKGSGHAALQDLIARTRWILSQKTKDKNKPYALHAPEVEGLAKGKARTPYEFGVKVSITTTHKEGLVVGMRSMPGNPYDGQTLAEALEQAAILSDTTPEVAVVDRAQPAHDSQEAAVFLRPHPCDVLSRLRRVASRHRASRYATP